MTTYCCCPWVTTRFYLHLNFKKSTRICKYFDTVSSQARKLELLDLTSNERRIDLEAKLVVGDSVDTKVAFTAEPDIDGVSVPVVTNTAEPNTDVKLDVGRVLSRKVKEVVNVGDLPQMKLCGLMIMLTVVALLFGLVKLARELVGHVTEYLVKEKKTDRKSKKSGFNIDDVFENTKCPNNPADIFADVV